MLLATAIVVGVGWYCTEEVPIDAIPNVGENQVIVFTEWPGRSPKDVEDQVTYPLSVALLAVPVRAPANTVEADKISGQLHYLRGCKETIEYLMTGQLPNDGNHDGMQHHKPRRHNDLGSLD